MSVQRVTDHYINIKSPFSDQFQTPYVRMSSNVAQKYNITQPFNMNTTHYTIKQLILKLRLLLIMTCYHFK